MFVMMMMMMMMMMMSSATSVFALIKFALIKRYHLHMCNSLAIIWKVAAVKFSCRLSSKWNNISKRFETSKWFELTLGLM